MPVVTLGDVMTREVISIDQEASVQVAAEKMRKENICSLIVQQAGNFIGVVTETDVVKKGVAERKNLSQTKVGTIMTSPIISIESTQPINKANIIMALKGIRHLPVSSGGKIVGIVSSKDLVSHLK
jgi:signal-transduction protein with cAMP-binding, CBS, and nucleotidyltransferase domain